MLKLLFMLLSFFGLGQSAATSDDQPINDTTNQGKDLPKPTVYHGQDGGDSRGGWDRN